MLNLSTIYYHIGHSALTGLLLILTSCGGGMSEQQMLQNAKSYIEQGDLKAASLELRNTLQENNKNAEARYLLGSISIKIGDYKTALNELNHASENGWHEEQVQFGKAQIFIGQGKLQKLLDDITDNNSWSVETRANILGLRALAQAGLGHTTLAKNTLDKGKTLNPEALHVLKTTVMFQLSGLLNGNPEESMKEALSLYPDNTALLFIHATIDTKNKNLSQASDTYKKIISLDPPNIITPYSRKAAIGLARIQIAQKNYLEASTTLTKILTRNENDPEANYLSALAAFYEKDYSRTENHLHKLLAVLPDHSQSLQLMGKVKYISRDYLQASQNFVNYLKTTPGDLTVQKLLAQTYIFLNQPEKAQSIIHALLAHNADDVTALKLQSHILFYKGDVSAAIKSLLKAINSEPRDINLREQLVKAYITLGETGQALNEIKTFHALSNDTETTQKLTISAYIQAGEVEKAINIAGEMLKENPQDATTLALNGTLHVSNNNDAQARIYFNRALQQEKNNLQATLGLALIERNEGHLDRASSLYNSLIESGQGGAIPMLALSEIAAQKKRENEMLTWLEKARNTSTDEIKSRLILANHYLQAGQLNKARTYINEAYKTSPENAEVLALYGKILIAQKRYSEAVPLLKKLVTKLPDPKKARIYLGEAYIGQGMIDPAREQFFTILKTNKSHFLALSLLAETELKEGNYNKSLEYSYSVQKAHPRIYVGFMHEGDVWMAKKDFNKARSAYDRAWRLQKTSKVAKRLFNAAINTANFEESIKAVLTWLKDNPEDYSTRTFLASKYLNAKQNDNAIREYEKILAKQPDSSTVLNNLAWLYYLKDDPRALDLAEQAYRIAPTNAGIQDTYGWILVQNNQAEKGKRLIKQALEQLPDNLEVHYHYAISLLKSDNKNESHQILEKLLSQDKPFNGRNEAQQLLGK